MAEIREALAGAAYDAAPDRLKLIPLKGEIAHLEAPDLIARAEKDTKVVFADPVTLLYFRLSVRRKPCRTKTSMSKR